jgi:hypothetical protein
MKSIPRVEEGQRLLHRLNTLPENEFRKDNKNLLPFSLGNKMDLIKIPSFKKKKFYKKFKSPFIDKDRTPTRKLFI